jgi:hypothetical protein
MLHLSEQIRSLVFSYHTVSQTTSLYSKKCGMYMYVKKYQIDYIQNEMLLKLQYVSKAGKQLTRCERAIFLRCENFA